MLTADHTRENEESVQFDALFQYASIGILLANQRAEIILANNFLLQLFGYSQLSELQGKPVEALLPGRFRTGHTGYRDNYMTQPGQRAMGTGRDLFALRKNGEEFQVEVSLSTYRKEDRLFVIAFVNDITERKASEKLLLQQQQQLEKVNVAMDRLNTELEGKVALRTQELQETMKMLERSRDEMYRALNKEKQLGEMKSRFVSMASHEFRTPLSTILSSASLASKYVKTEEQDKRDKHINRIKSAVYNLTDILNEFLSIGKLEDGKIKPTISSFNIEEKIRSICKEMQALARPGQKIQFVHNGDELVNLDQTLLRNILINLLSNAIKFSHPETPISVECRVDEGGISLKVTDKGIGMSAEDREHLFERFFRGANASNIQGTGLGLHIVSKYVELLNGTIDCHTELDKGTVFAIRFGKPSG
jgi:PAS domain S-box-containing protein